MKKKIAYILIVCIILIAVIVIYRSNKVYEVSFDEYFTKELTYYVNSFKNRNLKLENNKLIGKNIKFIQELKYRTEAFFVFSTGRLLVFIYNNGKYYFVETFNGPYSIMDYLKEIDWMDNKALIENQDIMKYEININPVLEYMPLSLIKIIFLKKEKSGLSINKKMYYVHYRYRFDNSPFFRDYNNQVSALLQVKYHYYTGISCVNGEYLAGNVIYF